VITGSRFPAILTVTYNQTHSSVHWSRQRLKSRYQAWKTEYDVSSMWRNY